MNVRKIIHFESLILQWVNDAPVTAVLCWNLLKKKRFYVLLIMSFLCTCMRNPFLKKKIWRGLHLMCVESNGFGFPFFLKQRVASVLSIEKKEQQ
jgi:hypothetical protein